MMTRVKMEAKLHTFLSPLLEENEFSASRPDRLTFILLMWRIGRSPNSNPIYSYIQQDARLHSLFISGNSSTCFGWYFHPSLEAYTTVSTESGICHTFIVICRYRGRVGNGLSMLWVAYYIWKLLYMFRVLLPHIIRSRNNLYTVSVICHTVAAIFRYRGRVGTSWSSNSYLLISWRSPKLLEFQLPHDSGR
jgi:hypothetical protein